MNFKKLFVVGAAGGIITACQPPAEPCANVHAILEHPSANWQVDVGPGNNFEDYVLNYRQVQKSGVDTLVPYIPLVLGAGQDTVKVSLAPIKKRRISRFAFDARATMKITHGSGQEVSVSWKENTESEKKHRATYDLSVADQAAGFHQEIVQFYQMNGDLHGLIDTLTPPDFPELGLPVVTRTYELEIRVESKGNDMTGYQEVVKHIANGYLQQFGQELCSMDAAGAREKLPLSISWTSGGKFDWQKILKGNQ